MTTKLKPLKKTPEQLNKMVDDAFTHKDIKETKPHSTGTEFQEDYLR